MQQAMAYTMMCSLFCNSDCPKRHPSGSCSATSLSPRSKGTLVYYPSSSFQLFMYSPDYNHVFAASAALCDVLLSLWNTLHHSAWGEILLKLQKFVEGGKENIIPYIVVHYCWNSFCSGHGRAVRKGGYRVSWWKLSLGYHKNQIISEL